MSEASHIFEESVDWLRQNYGGFCFFAERDIVWTLQLHLCEQIRARNLALRVLNDYPILLGKWRSLCADIVILNDKNKVEVAAEFKYEPAHERADIWHTKFPVVFWCDQGVGKDVQRVHEFVDQGVACVAYAIFIDEGGAFRGRPPHPGSRWTDWASADGCLIASVLWTRVAAHS